MISVIVPVYNAEKYLAQCIESILSQSFTDIEVILVDDCSDDASKSICRKYIELDQRVKFVELEKNSGQVNAYMEGIKAAKGKYLAFVDSDDWVAPDMFFLLHQTAVTYGAEIAASGCWHVYSDRRYVEPKDIASFGIRCFEPEEIMDSLYELHTRDNLIDHYLKLYRCNKIFLKRIVDANLKYLDRNVRVFEDNNFVIPCFIDAKRIVYVNKPLYYYRRYDGSTMSLINHSVLESNRTFLKRQKFIYQDKGVRHDMFSDALTVNTYSLGHILLSDLPYERKRSLLKEVGKDIRKYKNYGFDRRKYHCSFKLYLALFMTAKKLYFLVILMSSCARFWNRIKRM